MGPVSELNREQFFFFFFYIYAEAEKHTLRVWPVLDKNKWEIDANLPVMAFLISPFTSKCHDVVGTKMVKFVFQKTFSTKEQGE